MVGMAAPANPPDDPADAAALRRCADALADAVDAAVAGWVERAVTDRWAQWTGEPASVAVASAGRAAGERARDAVMPALRALLATDVDAQRTNPLSILRAAVVHPTAVLRGLGVPPVERDAHAERLFPDDIYELAPAAFADVDAALHEPGLVWGAAKAHVVLARRRRASG